MFVTRELPVTDSLTLVAGIAAGGFLIDVDHAVDYVLVDGQRDLRPGAFLHYYLQGKVKRVVLVLHSYELFVLLGLVAWRVDSLALWGYLMGALMHLALDIIFNGELAPRNIVAYYSFTYRMAHRFRAEALEGPRHRLAVSDRFWTAFFVGPTPVAAASVPAPRAARGLMPDEGR
jgi:hypothetical protein